MQLTKEAAEQKLSELKMDDLPLINITPQKASLSSDWFIKYKKACHEFALSLTDSIEELAFMNLSQDDFMNLIMGKKIPTNLSIRFRIPLLYGGEISPDNMFMCWTFPNSYRLDKFIADQAGSQTIWLPNPTKKIYISAHTASGGDGGNATSDRLSQLAAQLSQNRGME